MRLSKGYHFVVTIVTVEGLIRLTRWERVENQEKKDLYCSKQLSLRFLEKYALDQYSNEATSLLDLPSAYRAVHPIPHPPF